MSDNTSTSQVVKADLSSGTFDRLSPHDQQFALKLIRRSRHHKCTGNAVHAGRFALILSQLIEYRGLSG